MCSCFLSYPQFSQRFFVVSLETGTRKRIITNLNNSLATRFIYSLWKVPFLNSSTHYWFSFTLLFSLIDAFPPTASLSFGIAYLIKGVELRKVAVKRFTRCARHLISLRQAKNSCLRNLTISTSCEISPELCRNVRLIMRNAQSAMKWIYTYFLTMIH